MSTRPSHAAISRTPIRSARRFRWICRLAPRSPSTTSSAWSGMRNILRYERNAPPQSRDSRPANRAPCSCRSPIWRSRKTRRRRRIFGSSSAPTRRLLSLTRALTRAITEVVPGAAVSYGAVTNYIETLLVTERLIAWLSGFLRRAGHADCSDRALRRHVLPRHSPAGRDRRSHGARRGATHRDPHGTRGIRHADGARRRHRTWRSPLSRHAMRRVFFMA